MAARLLGMFDPSIGIRIGSIVIGVSILVAVITATVVAVKLAPNLTQSSIVEANMQIVVDRLIAIYELDQYYSANETLEAFILSLNEKFKLYFPESCINLIITYFDRKPVINGTLQDESLTQPQGIPSTVTLDATVYFNKSTSKDDIEAALINYTQTINLVNRYNGAPSGGLSTIDLGRSVFSGIYTTTLTAPVAQSEQSITISFNQETDVTQAQPDDPTTITTTTPSLSCQSFVQAYMRIAYARALAPDELRMFADPNSTLRDLNIAITYYIGSAFPKSFVKLDILLFSHEPILISNTTTSGTNNTTVIITIDVTVFYRENLRSSTISDAFTGSTQPITLLDQNNNPSSATANFSSKYSFFTDTLLPDLTPQQKTNLTAICENNSWMAPTSTTTTTTTTTSPTATTSTTTSTATTDTTTSTTTTATTSTTTSTTTTETTTSTSPTATTSTTTSTATTDTTTSTTTTATTSTTTSTPTTDTTTSTTTTATTSTTTTATTSTTTSTTTTDTTTSTSTTTSSTTSSTTTTDTTTTTSTSTTSTSALSRFHFPGGRLEF